MQSLVEHLLPYAVQVITENKATISVDAKSEKQIDGLYESYLSQFGPMEINLGLRNTLAVYLHKEKRDTILKLIFELLKKDTSIRFINNDKPNAKEWAKSLLTLQGTQAVTIDEANRQYILDASVALKRAIRTFELKKSDNNDND